MSASMNVLSPRPSLLDRRASNNIPDLPVHLSVSNLPHTSPPVASSSLPRTNLRRPSAGLLPFVPLTPIMASPLLTPDVAHASTPAAVFESPARPIVPTHLHPQSDYITHHHPFSINPTWTTCPPTPPPKNVPSPRLGPPTPSSTARATRHRSRSRSTVANLANSRPVSFTSHAPCPLSQSYSPPSSPHVAPDSPTRPASLPTRRLSLPSDLSKPLPPHPGLRTDGAPKQLPPTPAQCGPESAPIATDIEGTLLPSLSRRAHAPHKRTASLGSNSCETHTLRVPGRKLFDLEAHEGDSDEEDTGNSAYKESKRPRREEQVREHEMGRMRMKQQEKEKAERLRRYHALTELLTTEVGYLLDLRALVTVYLDQLVLLSSPPSTPTHASSPGVPLCANVLPPPSRTMSTFSALSIPSFFPSSRSSCLSTSPTPSPSPSTSEGLSGAGTDSVRSVSRERQYPGGSTHTDSALRERDREKDPLDRVLSLKAGKARLPGPILIEREVRAVCRNAQELLQFHERFVRELQDAVSEMGFRDAFLHLGEGEEQPVHWEGDAVEMVDRAVEVVAEKFVNEVASFSIYETFCPGHAAATDLVRRVQERWPSVWDAYDQRCALLVSQSLDTPSGESKDGSDAEMFSPISPASEQGHSALPQQTASLRKRRHSTPTLSFVFPASCSSNGAGSSEHAAVPPLPPLRHVSASAPLPATDTRVRGSSHKLKFMDYLIKPVQRLCKYPLLLDQLRNRAPGPNATETSFPVDNSEVPNGAVIRALQAMRGVVTRVNHASEKEAHNLRSALIASRIAFTSLPQIGAGLSTAVSSTLPPTSTPSSSECTTSSHGHSSSISSCSAISTAPTSPASPSSAACPTTLPTPRAMYLTADFVSSLGPCLLAGALDVVHHPATRARYLGVFLYAGGYCILAKMTKNGKVYEPRHWFALSEVEVEDVDEDDASFPYSFSISGFGHHLRVGSACSQEKAIWLSAIHEALAGTASWKNEPMSSLQVDDKTPPPLVSPFTDEPQELAQGLPTIQSLSDLERPSDPVHDPSGSMPSPAILRYSKTLSKLDGMVLKQDSHSQHATISAALSRRSSTASVKAFFSPISFESSRITRTSSTTRGQIEHALHDVFSESCLAARSQAQMRGEELFQVRAPGNGGGRKQGGMSRSNSGITIANAMGLGAAKRKYDMVSRRNRSVDLDMPVPPVPPMPADVGGPVADMGAAANFGTGLTGRAKSLAIRRHKRPPASIAPAISTAIAQMNADKERERHGATVHSSEALTFSHSPLDASHRSSISSVLPSPVDMAPLPIPVPGLSPNGTVRQSTGFAATLKDAKPKRTRSMVDNVRFFFQPSRSESPSPSSSSDAERASPTPSTPVDTQPTDFSTGIVQWLRRTSMRRRPAGFSSPSSVSVEDSSPDQRRPLPTRNSTDGVNVCGGGADFLGSSPSHLRPGFKDSPPPKRHRSLFVPSSSFSTRSARDRNSFLFDERPLEEAAPGSSLPTRSHSTLSTRKSLRNLLLFQRSNAFTPATPTR